MEKKCEVCGLPFNASKTRIRTCSRACGGVLRRKDQPPVSLTCSVCGLAYTAYPTRLRHGRQTTCSRECSYRQRGQKLDRGVSLVCGVCRIELRRTPSQIKAKHGAHYCSFACHQLGRGLGLTRRIVAEPYRYTEDGLGRLRVAGAHAYAAGKTLDFPEYELSVRDMLERLGIPFIHQHVIEFPGGAIAVDFLLLDRATILELDGPEHTDRQQGRERDAERDRLATALGLRVLRVSIRPDCPQEACQAVAAALAG